MKQGAHLRWFGIACLIAAGCTSLRDPNQVFVGVDAAGAISGGGSSSPSAGQSGSANAGTSGTSLTAGTTSRGGAAAGDAGGANRAGDGGEGGSSSSDCQDETGFHGLGCYSCAPTEISTLENACTSATCTPFDNALRLTKLEPDGSLPPLAPTNAGGAGGAAGSGGSGGAIANGGAGGATGTGNACADVAKSGGTIVYITGSSAAQPFLQQIARQLAQLGIFIVYESSGSCVGVDAIINGTPMTTGSSAPALSATYWDSVTSTGTACDLPSEGVSADIGASDVFAQTCPGFDSADLDARQVRDAHGPIQTMTFAVPASSIYTGISAEAAYFVFGFGATGGVLDAHAATPIWNNEDYIFKRSATSGTQAMLAAAIGVPAAAWKGKGHKSSGDVTGDLQLAGQDQDTANQAIGIVASDYIESNALQGSVKVLAFQDTGQHCAVYPSSTSGARDKQNVRDGHYPVWSPLHLLVRVDSLGNPINAANRQAVTDILGYLSGTKALPSGTPLIGFYAASGLVPECAMHVTRTKDGGNILPYKSDNPCSCLFDSLVSTTTCATCTVQGNCKTGETCSQSFCEPQ